MRSDLPASHSYRSYHGRSAAARAYPSARNGLPIGFRDAAYSIRAARHGVRTTGTKNAAPPARITRPVIQPGADGFLAGGTGSGVTVSARSAQASHPASEAASAPTATTVKPVRACPANPARAAPAATASPRVTGFLLAVDRHTAPAARSTTARAVTTPRDPCVAKMLIISLCAFVGFPPHSIRTYSALR